MDDGSEFLIVHTVSAVDSEAGGDADAFPFERERENGELLPKAIYSGFDVFSRYVGEDHEEFVATEARAHVRGAGIFLQQVGEGLEDDITGFVAKGIVDSLEAVDVPENDPKREAMAR